MSHTYDHGGNVFDVARQLGVAPETLTDFSASINPLGLSELVKKAIVNAVDSLIHYPDSSHHDLKNTLATHHGISPSNIVVANGSTELIYHIPAILHGKRALIISPSFSEYVRALSQQQWDFQHFTLDHEHNFSLDLAKLEMALAHGFDALYFCNPANPGGNLYPLSVIEQVYVLCRAAGTFLVLDEAFMDFCEESSAKHFMVNADNGIVLRSMTKFYGIPGLRLGYAIGSSALTERLDAMGGPWSVNTLALAAGTAALQDSDHNQQTIEYIHQERRTLAEKLSEFRQLRVFPSNVNYLLVQITEGDSALEVCKRLLHQKILVRDCSSFTGLSSRFIRIAVRTTEENERLLKALKNVLG